MNKLFFIISMFWIFLFLARFTLDWNPNEMVFDYILSAQLTRLGWGWMTMADPSRQG